MIIGVPKETFPGERRVALTPDVVPTLAKAKMEVLVQAGAGQEAGFPDKTYEEKGAKIAKSRDELFAQADTVATVRLLGANLEKGRDDLAKMKSGQALIGFAEPLSELESVQELASKGVAAFSMELMPRITRAQSMDALSSMATVAGYKAVLLAANAAPRMFPMLMTAAGTVAPAHVFIIGAGVAGLQAIASAKRLGGLVYAYDIRPAVKEQCESLGAKFVEFDLDTGTAEGKGGYAKAMGEEFYRKQRECMAKELAGNHVVITTAAVPGKKAPILITKEMVKGMMPGSVIVDLAAERGGNCELTTPGETVVKEGVTILGPLNIPATIPFHASQMYAKNVTTFLKHLVKEGEMAFDEADEITQETLLTRNGKVVHARVNELLGSPAQTERKAS